MPHQVDRQTEEELHAIYDQSYVDEYDPHAVARMRRMLPFFDLSGDEVVADFACGNGVLLELISPRVREYVGVDFSEAFVRAAEPRGLLLDHTQWFPIDRRPQWLGYQAS